MKYSQYNIEEIIESLINKEKGFFIEIGAGDGIIFSTTKYFEDKGWKGICIEPNPNQFKKLKANRICTVYNCAIWNKNESVPFIVTSGYTELLNGILDAYDPRHLNRLNWELSSYGGKKEVIMVEAKTFNSIISPEQSIDFMSVDTEGSELDILKSIDFDSYNIKVLMVENNFNNPDIGDYLSSFGYIYHSTHGQTDQIFYKI